MEQIEAEKLGTGPDEVADLQDDNVVMNLEDEITKDIQRNNAPPPAQPKRTKRDRSPAQIAAFEKAQAKLREKRAATRAAKEATIAPQAPRQPKKSALKKAKPQAQVIHFEESSSEEEPEPVVYVRRRKKKKKPQRQVVYYSSTSSEEEENTQTNTASAGSTNYQQTHPLDYIRFV
jgi:hypothetical protein